MLTVATSYLIADFCNESGTDPVSKAFYSTDEYDSLGIAMISGRAWVWVWRKAI